MNREIKFRDWNPETKEMRYFNLDGYDREVHDAYGNIMQFTGLLDKNGKEVFEGDIIKIKCNEDIIIGDVFYNQTRCCYMINQPAGYNGSFGLQVFTLTVEICDEFNIIGNIYQHKNLLD
jgi:hypothetical protein